MGKINNLQLYPLDNTITAGDYFLGTDSGMGNRTVNFSMGALTSYLDDNLNIGRFIRNDIITDQTVQSKLTISNELVVQGASLNRVNSEFVIQTQNNEPVSINPTGTGGLRVGTFPVITAGASSLDTTQVINSRLRVGRSIEIFNSTNVGVYFRETDGGGAGIFTESSIHQDNNTLRFNSVGRYLFQGNNIGDDYIGMTVMDGGSERDVLHEGNISRTLTAYTNTGFGNISLPNDYTNYNFVSLVYSYTPSGGSLTNGTVSISTGMLSGNTGDRPIAVNADVTMAFNRSNNNLSIGGITTFFNEVILTF